MPIRIDPEAFAMPEQKLQAWTAELMDSPARYSYFGCVEDSDRKLVLRMSEVAPLAAYYYGAFTRLWNMGLQLSAREVIEDVVAAGVEAGRSLGQEITGVHVERLVARLTRGTPTAEELEPGSDPVEGFLMLHEAIATRELLPPKRAFGDVVTLLAKQAARDDQVFANVYTPPPEALPRPESLDRTGADASRYRLNADKRAVDRWPDTPAPGTLDPDDHVTTEASPPHTTPDGDERYWVRWSAVEWPELVPTESAMLYCHAPVNAPSAISQGGDRPRLIELPDGPILRYPRRAGSAVRSGHVERVWTESLYRNYWVEMPRRADLVRLGQRNHLYTAFVEPDPGSDIDWEALRARIERELKDKKVEEKIRERIAKEAGKLLEGVSFFGFGLGGLASGAASLAASLIMELIEWLLDEFFGGATLRPIISVHKTLYTAATPPMSYVDYKTKDASGQEVPLAPVYPKDPSSGAVGPDAFQPFPRGRNGFIEWSGECEAPTRGAMPVRMVNCRSGAVFWPQSQRNGARVFVVLSTPSGEPHYVVALRTEVRSVPVRFQ